jgi:hypothetical protein
MQISSVSTAYGGSQAQRMLSALLQPQTAAGQDMPGAGETSGGSRPSGPPPGPAPNGGPSGQFAAHTLSDLLSTQEDDDTSPFANIAAKLISQADTDGDGALSLDEIQATLGADEGGAADSLTAAIKTLDTDGDGKLGAAELSAALDAFRTANQRGHAAGSTGASTLQATA